MPDQAFHHQAKRHSVFLDEFADLRIGPHAYRIYRLHRVLLRERNGVHRPGLGIRDRATSSPVTTVHTKSTAKRTSVLSSRLTKQFHDATDAYRLGKTV